STAELRSNLIERLHDFRTSQQRGTVVDFDPATFDPDHMFARMGGGSLGGKGRGLAFVATLLDTYRIGEGFPEVRISVPSGVVLGTDVFDQFIEENNLQEFALSSDDDDLIRERFVAQKLPPYIVQSLRALVTLLTCPLAVRSSSLLEDSQHLPFAGIYDTYMLANNSQTIDERLKDLTTAIKLVFASAFSAKARAYMRATPYRLEEEKMAVVIQRLVGTVRGDRFYPDFAGVAKSHNFYPVAPMEKEDGVVSVGLGLGTQVVEGGATVRFSPKYPRHIIQFSSPEDALTYSQREFFALDLGEHTAGTIVGRDFPLARCDLHTAEEDGTLNAVGSTYSAENNAIYDGLGRKGTRIVSFAPVLKSGVFPLADMLRLLLEVGRSSMSAAVEIEFAVNLGSSSEETGEFAIVQMRPMVINDHWEDILPTEFEQEQLVCESRQVLGNGIIDGVTDIVTVDLNKFDRSATKIVAAEVGLFNHRLTNEERPYVLFGIGRWGSSDPWLGIPVSWEQISGAKVIIETGFEDIKVTPSQGSHFFQNLATMEIGYFTIDHLAGDGFIDWDWLLSQATVEEQKYTRHIRLKEPLSIRMSGRENHGVILKPEE
ncbi:MAG: PEP/pyruvate-binding domain-containing protein, partial [candidate division Zixibacteria bacterium]